MSKTPLTDKRETFDGLVYASFARDLEEQLSVYKEYYEAIDDYQNLDGDELITERASRASKALQAVKTIRGEL